MTRLFVEQPLALPGSANKYYVTLCMPSDLFSKEEDKIQEGKQNKSII